MDDPKQLINSKIMLNPLLAEIKKPTQEKGFFEDVIVNKSIDLKVKTHQEVLWILTGIGIAVLLMLSVF